MRAREGLDFDSDSFNALRARDGYSPQAKANQSEEVSTLPSIYVFRDILTSIGDCAWITIPVENCALSLTSIKINQTRLTSGAHQNPSWNKLLHVHARDSLIRYGGNALTHSSDKVCVVNSSALILFAIKIHEFLCLFKIGPDFIRILHCPATA